VTSVTRLRSVASKLKQTIVAAMCFDFEAHRP
jgi:hypothetical protein